MNNEEEKQATEQRLTKVQQLIMELVTAHPAVNVTPATIVTYQKYLFNTNPIDLETAISRIIIRCDYFPSIAEILKKEQEIKTLRETKEDQQRRYAEKQAELEQKPKQNWVEP